MTPAQLLDEIERYNFACDCGPLVNCDPWQQLRALTAPLGYPYDSSHEQQAVAAVDCIYSSHEWRAMVRKLLTQLALAQMEISELHALLVEVPKAPAPTL